MTGGQLAIGGGLLVGLGLVLAVRAWRPAPPALAAALAQLSGGAAPLPSVAASTRWWLPAGWASRLAARPGWKVGCSDEDLAILGWTREQLTARKLTLAAAGLLAPSALSVVLAVLGLGGIAAFPAVAGVAIAVIGWRTPSAEAKELADRARVAFRTNLEFFLTLVAGERRARGSVEQALDEAVRVSGTAAFGAMRRVIRRADLAGEKPWAALRRLGEELAVPELKNLADIAATAADGAAVYQTLLAAARTLRHTELAQARTEANLISERMARPLSLLVFGLMLFVMVPFVLRMLDSG